MNLMESFLSGYLVEIDALECAHVCNSLGAGRSKAGDILDYGVGLEILLNVGNQIKEGLFVC